MHNFFKKHLHMKSIRFYLSLYTILSITQFSTAQKNNDATIFTYGGNPVSKSEFLRMYTKNTGTQKADFSEAALREYITLYSRFKMKVAQAEEMHMDTLPNIKTELGGYKKQLAKSYLTDKEVTEKLVKEAYERKKKDVRVAHILISPPKAGNDDTLKTFLRVDSIYKSILAGADFEKIAKAVSEDKPSGANGGDIGFFTALQLIYPFENVAYSTPVGTVAKPFRTVYGYHIIKKLDERPARGEMQVAQILVQVQQSKGKEGDDAAKARIDSVYKMLKTGENFEKLVDMYSEDKFSKNTKGTLPTFSVGQMVTEFEDAAYALKNPGDISTPIKTKFGYHIIKLIKKIPLQPFDSVKTEMTKRVEKDGRMEIARQQFTESTKRKLKYKENIEALDKFIAAIPDSTLTNGSFKASNYKNYNQALFEMDGGNVIFTQADFANYIEMYTKGKIYGSKETSLKSLFKNYTEKAVYDYQENKLIDENEEYKNLLTEYRDGIMLFELTDKAVWTRAAGDTIGLQAYFEKNKQKYMWTTDVVKANIYKANNEDNARKIVKELNTSPRKKPEDIINTVNADGAQNNANFETGKYDKSRFPANAKFEAGKYLPYFKNEDGSYTIAEILETYDTPQQKSLSEARGYVISDYQEYLEKTWISDLEAKYPVVVNEATLKTMVKK